MTRTGVLIHPLDTLFFRGGRPFGAGLRAESGLPASQVFAGLIRTILLEKSGADFRAMRGKGSSAESFRAAGAEWVAHVKCRGPWLAQVNGTSVEPLTPTPANLRLTAEGGVLALWPRRRPVPGWTPREAGMLPLWAGGTALAKGTPGYLSLGGLRKYILGQCPAITDFCDAEKLFAWEERTGVGIDPGTYAAQEGEIFSTRNIRLRTGVAFYGEVELPQERVAILKHVTAWGGERHHVAVEPVRPVAWPEAGGERALALMLSPGLFRLGWRPARIAAGALRGAALKGPFAVSGWDLTRGGPKATRFGVDAGSVYFLEGLAGLTASLSETDEDNALGYGFYLKGTWNYAQ